MKLKTIIPLFLFCTLLIVSKAQTTKEWYFFDPSGLSNGLLNKQYNNVPVSHDSLLFGFIASGSYHWVYKYTHRQGFIKKTKFVGINNYIEAADMCIDTIHKFIFTFSRSGPRPPYNKFSHGVIFKLDYDLNILDSLIISFSTLYDPVSLAIKNNKLYVAGFNNNYFSTPIKVNITVYDLNLQQLNRKVVSDTTQNCYAKKILFDNDNNIRLYMQVTNSVTTVFPLMILDTNLNTLNNFCILKRCGYSSVFPNNILKDANGFTYSFDDYAYKTNFQPYSYIKDYHVRVNETEDTVNSTYFFKNIDAIDFYSYRITHLQKTKNNGYIGLGSNYGYSYGADPNNSGKFFIMDSTLKLINQFDVLKFTTAKLETTTPGKIKIGQTGSGMYYVVGEAKDSTQTNYKGVFYLMSIDSTAKITPPTATITPTVTPETTWENITIFPNPTNDLVTIALPPNSNYNINVYNTLGQQLISFNDVSNNRQISLANLPTGVYHFTFYETSLKKNITKKVIVER